MTTILTISFFAIWLLYLNIETRTQATIFKFGQTIDHATYALKDCVIAFGFAFLQLRDFHLWYWYAILWFVLIATRFSVFDYMLDWSRGFSFNYRSSNPESKMDKLLAKVPDYVLFAVRLLTFAASCYATYWIYQFKLK